MRASTVILSQFFLNIELTELAYLQMIDVKKKLMCIDLKVEGKIKVT